MFIIHLQVCILRVEAIYDRTHEMMNGSLP